MISPRHVALRGKDRAVSGDLSVPDDVTARIPVYNRT